MQKNHNPTFSAADTAILANYKKHIDHSTRFIPLWVKVAVAMALGLGTMVGWKRIVVTVGEKIGKQHLTYAQGAVAEITADGNHRRSRRIRVPRQHHSRALLRHRWHHGRQPFRNSVVYGTQPSSGLGPQPCP